MKRVSSWSGWSVATTQPLKQPRGKRLVRVCAGTLAVGLVVSVVSCRGADAGRSDTSGQDCSVPTYEPGGRTWAQLPPAVVAQSSDGCVGYCFNAVIESKITETERSARVVVLDKDGAPTRGIVDVSVNSLDLRQDGTTLRFACFDRFDDGEVAPRFDDCVQMIASVEHVAGCDTTDTAAVATRSYR